MNEVKHLKIECHRIVNKIVAKGEICKKDLFIALAIRLKLPINKCFINDFDEEMLKKALKELKYMQEL